MLEVKYVYKVRGQGQATKNEPFGEGHLFPVSGGEIEASFCGKGVYDVGKETSVRKMVIQSLPLCPECVLAWKNHPLSPWHKFVTVVKVME